MNMSQSSQLSEMTRHFKHFCSIASCYNTNISRNNLPQALREDSTKPEVKSSAFQALPLIISAATIDALGQEISDCWFSINVPLSAIAKAVAIRTNGTMSQSSNIRNDKTHTQNARRNAMEQWTSRQRVGLRFRKPVEEKKSREMFSEQRVLFDALTFRFGFTTPPLSLGSMEHEPTVSISRASELKSYMKSKMIAYATLY